MDFVIIHHLVARIVKYRVLRRAGHVASLGGKEYVHEDGCLLGCSAV
jgi:hypothetical protein